MKQGWIQVTSNGTKEQLAPKTMADMVYMDETEGKTVKDALKTVTDMEKADATIHVYTHNYNPTTKVHNFTDDGTGHANGRAYIKTAFTVGDTFAVNGVDTTAHSGAYVTDDLPLKNWVTFVYDRVLKILCFKLGGAERNYRVITVASVAALPTPAPENTFAIITSTAMGSKARFLATQPSSTGTGDIWIRTFDAHRRISVNMSKRDLLYIYPVGVRQYNGSAWVNRDARIYQSGVWKELTQYLYNNGTFVVSGNDEIRFSSVTRNATNYACLTQAGKAYPYAGISWPVDLTNVNKVCAEMESTHDAGEIRVFTSKDATAASKITSQSTIYAIYSLDVSALKGTHKIYVGTRWDESPAGYKETYVKNVYLT